MRTTAIVLVLLATSPVLAGPRQEPPIDPRAALRSMEEAFSAVADRVMPAVVNVSTIPRRALGPPESPQRFREFFGEEFHERYFGRRPRPREDPRAAGSGVLVDPNGYILTNNHVVENAQEIIVRLSDARRFTATLVGRDPKTDLAVLKIDAPAPLPAAELGDSDGLRVGQWAIAIGNPFGLDQTVTVGVVSATARADVGIATYENFIQTDASINPGNSGGPLVNLRGEVIGINTAIVAAGQGIGFAIPANMVKRVTNQLVDRGKVLRGWLGVSVQPLSKELAESLGLKETRGAVVARVYPDSPAAAAGLTTNDVIVGYDGTPVDDYAHLQRLSADTEVGRTVKLDIVRKKEKKSVALKIAEAPEAGACGTAWRLDRAGGTFSAVTSRSASAQRCCR